MGQCTFSTAHMELWTTQDLVGSDLKLAGLEGKKTKSSTYLCDMNERVKEEEEEICIIGARVL